MNCKEKSKDIKKAIKEKIVSKKIMLVIKILFIFVVIYFFVGIILLLIGSLVIFIYILPEQNIIIKAFYSIFNIYIKSFTLIPMLPYIISFLLLSKGIYTNKILKDEIKIINWEEQL